MRLILALILLPILLWSKTIFIQDEFTLQPIYNATVNDSLKSDIHGRVKIDTTLNQFIITKTGYKTKTINYKEIKELNFKIMLSPKDFETEEVVVSATHWESNRQKIPVKISNIEQSRVIMQNPQTAADLVGSSGEIFVQKSQLGGGSPMIRGFATNRVMITVDGVRMNNAIFRSGNVQNIINIDPFAVDRTELVFGPGSVLYGSDAIGGVMNFHTKDPQLKTEDNDDEYCVNIRSSSANFERTVNLGWESTGEKFGYVVNTTATAFDDQIMGSNGPDDYLRPEYVTQIDGMDTIVQNSNPEKQVGTGFNLLNWNLKFLYEPNENLKFKLSYMNSRTNDIPRYDRLVRYRGDQLRSGDWFYGPQKWQFYNFTTEYSKPSSFFDEAKLTLAYQFFEESRNTRDFQDVIRDVRTEQVDAYSANLDFLKNFNYQSNTNSFKTELYYGAEAVLNHVNSEAYALNISTNSRDALDTRYPDGSDWFSSAIYANLKHNLSQELSLYAGTRLNFITLNAPFDTTFFPLPFTEASYNNFALNGSIGAAWRPSYDFQINANISTGFRAPNIDDIGKVFDSEPGSVVVPNANISAEYAYNFELSAEKSFGEILKLDISGYYTILQDALVRRNFTLNGSDSIIYDGELSQVQAIQNAASAYVYGLQGYAEIRLPLDLAISSRINIQIGEEELDDGSTAPLRHAAPTFGKTILKYQREKLRLEFYAEYSAEFSNDQLAPSEQSKDFIYALDENGLPYSPSWYTLNLKGIYRLNKNFLFSGGIENITDQRYRTYSSGIAAPGINFIGSVRIKFSI